MSTLNFDKLSKKGTYAIYSGLRAKIRVPVTIFTDSKPPASFEATGAFAGPRQPKPKMTAEERKAWRAAQPKLTLAEKIARREAQLAKMKAALETEQQPVGA